MDSGVTRPQARIHSKPWFMCYIYKCCYLNLACLEEAIFERQSLYY